MLAKDAHTCLATSPLLLGAIFCVVRGNNVERWQWRAALKGFLYAAAIGVIVGLPVHIFCVRSKEPCA